ncbi:OmpP1/FadL family transporter [Lysobacter humi (ex Lee et al. 2017)]
MQVHGFMRLTALAFGIGGALAMGNAQASGFQLKENSVRQLGSAFSAGAAAEGDTSVVVNNPAQMTSLEGTTVKSDVSVISVDAEFTGAGYDVAGRPISGGNGGNAGGTTPIPALSVVHKFDNGVALGAMVSAPFGLKTEYDQGWVGRYYAQTSDVKIVDLTLSGAVDLVPDKFSVGAGLIYSRADVTLSKAVDFGTLLFLGLPAAQRPFAPAFARPQGSDGFAEIEGQDNGVGYVLGMSLRPTENLTVALSHRSEIDYDLRGTADWTVPTQARAQLNAVGRAAFFNDGGAGAHLTTPATTTFSIAYDVSDSLKLMTTYSETEWSSIQEVRIDFDNIDPDSVEEFRWVDTAFMALGAEFKLNDAWTLRAGYAYDETPTTYAHRTPRLPDEDRKWYSLGATWAFSDALTFDLAYTHISPDKPQVGIMTAPAAGGQSLFGSYDSSVNILGFSGQLKF